MMGDYLLPNGNVNGRWNDNFQSRICNRQVLTEGARLVGLRGVESRPFDLHHGVKAGQDISAVVNSAGYVLHAAGGNSGSKPICW